MNTNIKIKYDLSDLITLCRVKCMAINCKHNTGMRSGGHGIAECDYKHVWISAEGKCTAFQTEGYKQVNETQKQIEPVLCDCGFKPYVFETREGDWVVHCKGCSECTLLFPTRDEAVEDWNKVMGGE